MNAYVAYKVSTRVGVTVDLVNSLYLRMSPATDCYPCPLSLSAVPVFFLRPPWPCSGVKPLLSGDVTAISWVFMRNSLPSSRSRAASSLLHLKRAL